MSIYIYYDQQTSGPYEENAVAAWLHAGQLSPEVLACRQGASQWQPLRDILPVPAPRAADGGAHTQSASPVRANVQAQPEKGTCEKCGRHEGRVYSFTFGRMVSHTMTRSGHTNIHTMRYSVDGRKYVAACDGCIRRRRVTFLVVFGLMVAVGAGLGFLAVTVHGLRDPSGAVREIAGYDDGIGIAGAVIGLIGLRFLLPNIFRGKITHAENLIIALKKRELRKQGFKTFWNTRNYNKLRRG